jgi:asparagine synthase (glutamine-hydrolysing)
VRSFSVGFADAAYDESRFARPVAAHLGTDHTEVFMTAQDVVNTIPKLPSMFDEPFADSSQIPTHLVSAVARQHVTVALSGDGGDELFGGYVRYTAGQTILRRIALLPPAARRMLARALSALPPAAWERLLSVGGALLPADLRRPVSGERIQKLSRILRSGDTDALYFELVCHWPELVDDTVAKDAFVSRSANDPPPLLDPVERMMFFDQISYLPNDILTKVDRATMAVSLEAREPLLDYRLVELAWTLPLAMKVSSGTGKRVLRQILRHYVPDALIDRPKMGFGIPLAGWLRSSLRDWAESLLDPSRLADDGLDPGPIRAKWQEHLSGQADWKFQLWAILMLQAWLAEHHSPARAAA